MPVLREVVTRFKFETDEQAARKVDQRVNKMKRGISGIGKVLGVALGIAGAKALFSFGQGATRAEFTLKNLAGIEFAPLRQSMNRIRNDLDLIRKGAGAIFRERDFDIAAAGFVRTFGAGRKQLELFDQIFRSAAKQSAITGQNVAELVQQLTQAITSGDFSALLELPGIDQSFVKRLEDINELFNLGEIGGQSAIRRRSEALANALEMVTDRQDKSLKNVPAQLLLADRAAKKTQDSTERFAESLNRTLIPVMEKLNIVLDKFVTTTEQIEKKGFFGTLQESIRSLGASQRDERLKRIEDLRKGKTTSGFSRDVRAAQQLGPLPGGEKSIIFNSTINVNGAGDPVAVAKEVERIQNETFKNALSNVIPTEDR